MIACSPILAGVYFAQYIFSHEKSPSLTRIAQWPYRAGYGLILRMDKRKPVLYL